jgi:hypothetical protein
VNEILSKLPSMIIIIMISRFHWCRVGKTSSAEVQETKSNIQRREIIMSAEAQLETGLMISIMDSSVHAGDMIRSTETKLEAAMGIFAMVLMFWCCRKVNELTRKVCDGMVGDSGDVVVETSDDNANENYHNATNDVTTQNNPPPPTLRGIRGRRALGVETLRSEESGVGEVREMVPKFLVLCGGEVWRYQPLPKGKKRFVKQLKHKRNKSSHYTAECIESASRQDIQAFVDVLQRRED